MATRWNIVETHAVERRKTPDGRKCVNNYALLRTLGHGRFAKVKLAERLLPEDFLSSAPPSLRPTFADAASAPPPARRRQFAIKIFSKKNLAKMKEYVSTEATITTTSSSSNRDSPAPSSSSMMRVVTALDRVRDEIAIMRTLYHRNIVLFFEVIDADADDSIYLVLEYMPHGPCMVFHPDTKQFTSPLTQSILTDALASSHMRDVLKGLEYLHARGVCHRDIKPDNILVNADGRCHLSDFGCALQQTSRPDDQTPVMVTDTVGTYQFLAPECCAGEPYDPFQADVWAVGVVLYIFLFGLLPFQAESTKELFDDILRGDVTVPDTRRIAPECLDLLRRLLAKDPSTRISIADALRHAWLNPPSAQDDEEPPSF